MKTVLLAVAVLALCGCQSATGGADKLTIAPPSVRSVSYAPGLSPSQGQTASAPTMPTLQDTNASTVAFLKALVQAIHAKQQVDMGYQAGTVGVGLDLLQQSRNRRQNSNETSSNTAPQPYSLDSMAQINQKHLDQTTAILNTLAQNPVPPDCQRLMQEYRALYQVEAASIDQALQNMRTGTEVSREAERQQKLELGRRAAFINQEIERIRTSATTIAEQVPPFGITH